MQYVHIILTLALVVIALALMFLVLIQRSKGEGLGGAFGMGGGSDTVLGSRVNVLQRYTWYLVAGFMILCFVIGLLPPAQTGQETFTTVPSSPASPAGVGTMDAAGPGTTDTGINPDAPVTGDTAGEGAAPEGAAPPQ